jgi:hypothetical protein
MLMFTNAIMYNNCNHNVHKMAVEMYDDVMTHIEVRSGRSKLSYDIIKHINMSVEK